MSPEIDARTAEDGPTAHGGGAPQLMDLVQQEVVHQVQERPYIAVLVAVAAGYVLGNGLPNWASRLAINVGTRFALGRVAAMFGDPLE